MDRFEAMTAFVAVAKRGGFSAAARDLGIPLATISRRVAELEAELGRAYCIARLGACHSLSRAKPSMPRAPESWMT